jgi:hypothetical protein
MGGGHTRSYPGVPPQNINFSRCLLSKGAQTFTRLQDYKMQNTLIPARLGARFPDPDFHSWKFSPSDLRPLRLRSSQPVLFCHGIRGIPSSIGFWLKSDPISSPPQSQFQRDEREWLCHAWAVDVPTHSAATNTGWQISFQGPVVKSRSFF